MKKILMDFICYVVFIPGITAQTLGHIAIKPSASRQNFINSGCVNVISGTTFPGMLIEAGDGKLYGMTAEGGSCERGVIFSFDPVSSTYTTLKDFNGISGAFPNGNLVEASDGKLYGMTYGGGHNDQGVIFSFDPVSSAYTKLFDFDGTNGAFPDGSFIHAADGKLYSTTYAGGINNLGVIFSFDPESSAYTKVKDFDEIDGAYPYGNLFRASNGTLYGMTRGGGRCDLGVMFSFDPSTSIYTKLKDYEGGSANSYMASGLHRLYETTRN